MEQRGELVQKEILPYEPCVRCAFHPLQFSKGRLRREALLPPPNRGKSDVSLLRLNYMSLDECIRHGKKTTMGAGQRFTAIASITRTDVAESNEWAKTAEVDGSANGTSADIYYAPMHAGHYIDLTQDVYAHDPSVDLPAHADLRYDSNLDSNVQTRLRQYASHLVKKARILYTEE